MKKHLIKYEITVATKTKPTPAEINEMMHNILGRMQGYSTTPPEFYLKNKADDMLIRFKPRIFSYIWFKIRITILFKAILKFLEI